MQQREFLEMMADIMEVETEQLEMNTNFRIDLESWDSMKGFMLLLTVEEQLQIEIDVEAFLAMKTFDDIYMYITYALENR